MKSQKNLPANSTPEEKVVKTILTEISLEDFDSSSGTKAITDTIAYLMKKVTFDERGNPIQVGQLLGKRILDKALAGDEKMIKLVWAYLEGLPQQTTTTNINQTVVNTTFTPEQILKAREVQRKILNAEIK